MNQWNDKIENEEGLEREKEKKMKQQVMERE